MKDFEDADVDGELETVIYIGQDYLLRVVDVLKPERIMEIEVEVLGLRSSSLRPSGTWKRPMLTTNSSRFFRTVYCDRKSHYQHVVITTLGSNHRADASGYKPSLCQHADLYDVVELRSKDLY